MVRVPNKAYSADPDQVIAADGSLQTTCIDEAVGV